MKKRIAVFALIAILIYAVGGIIYYFVTKEEHKTEAYYMAEIEGYPYKLRSDATPLMILLFSDLIDVLEHTDINDEEFAKLIGQLFIVDLFTMTNKQNKYDAGGYLYVYPDHVENFKFNVNDTLYRFLEDNTNGKRKQSLPEVSSIEVTEVEEIEFKSEEKTYNAFRFIINWKYLEDLGYQDKAEVKVARVDKFYFVVEQKQIDEE